MNDSLKKAAWIAYGKELVSKMENFIQSWDLKSASTFEMGQVKFDWSTSRRCSRGGLYKVNGIWMPGINIAMHFYTSYKNTNIHRWYEYKSFDSDPIIGGFYTDNITHMVDAVIAHEMAHAIQHWHQWSYKLKFKPHGDEFKTYYRLLREEFVNNKLPNQTEMGAEYRKLYKIAFTQEVGPARIAA